jgi:hypothetical protein
MENLASRDQNAPTAQRQAAGRGLVGVWGSSTEGAAGSCGGGGEGLLAGGGRSRRATGLGRLGLLQEAIKRALDEAGLLLLQLGENAGHGPWLRQPPGRPPPHPGVFAIFFFMAKKGDMLHIIM